MKQEVVPSWKMNGWNLQPSPMKRKENHQNQPPRILEPMLILQGVTVGDFENMIFF